MPPFFAYIFLHKLSITKRSNWWDFKKLYSIHIAHLKSVWKMHVARTEIKLPKQHQKQTGSSDEKKLGCCGIGRNEEVAENWKQKVKELISSLQSKYFLPAKSFNGPTNYCAALAAVRKQSASCQQRDTMLAPLWFWSWPSHDHSS